MATLGGYLNKKVLIVTADSRILVGNLAACDNSTNLVLSGATERIIETTDSSEPSQEIPLGAYLVRGDNVCTIGLVDEKLDDSINWTEVKGYMEYAYFADLEQRVFVLPSLLVSLLSLFAMLKK